MSSAIDVFAIGSCLTDIHCQVKTMDDVAQIQMEYGLRTLANPQKQKLLLSQLPKQLKLSPGGCAATVASVVGTLGGSAFFAGRLGQDEYGQFNLDDFKTSNIQFNPDKIISSMDTGTCVCVITPDKNRSMSTCLGANEDFDVQHIDVKHLHNSNYLYVEGYLVNFPNGLKLMHETLEIIKPTSTKAAFVFCDPCVPKYFRENLNRILKPGNFDVIICNEEESHMYCNTENKETLKNEFLHLAPEVVITKGDQGAQYISKGVNIDVPAIPTKVVDTTGAGDSFAGAFLYARSQNKNPKESLEFATLVSSKVIQSFGPRLSIF